MFWRSLPAAPLEHRLRRAFRHRFQRVLRTIAFPESDSKKDINSCCYSLGAVGFLFTAYIERTQSGSRLEPTLL